MPRTPKCAACDETGEVNVHHKFPFHYVVACGRPDLELDPRNLVTLCIKRGGQHHLLLGHLDDWESYNLAVNSFIKRFADKGSTNIRAVAAWKKAAAARPKHLEQITVAGKAAFKAILDKKFKPLPAMMAKAAKARVGMDPCNTSSMKITDDLQKYAAAQGITDKAALKMKWKKHLVSSCRMAQWFTRRFD